MCASEHGVSKSAGLLARVLQRWPVAPPAVLHVGDSARADLQSAMLAGMRGVLLQHVDEDVAAQERMYAMALTLVEPAIHRERSLARPYHGVLASASVLDRPQALIGYAALGPIKHAFARFVLDERDALIDGPIERVPAARANGPLGEGL